ncbi:MAG: threonylcarbamoyl-AMP synthase [Odoribacteraceae bacterium]|jgi:L-threonylcarbamoyladenylate synthase|nr:threonylcarbamoyl-AMP synthase [Odoribacteraceae bacterium]
MITVGKTVEVLRAGGVVLLPTDTVYGLAARPDDDAALDRLFALKARPREVYLPVMVAGAAWLEGLGVEMNEAARRLSRSRFMPGPLTLVLGFGAGERVAWLAGREEVAVRVPDDAFLLAVLREAGPLLVTSANRHGRGTRERARDILPELAGAPDLVIERGRGREVPSTIVNCRREPPVIERRGLVAPEEIYKITGHE